MSKRHWINDDGEIVPPNAPRSAGGPGGFRSATSLGNIDFSTSVPHQHSPLGRWLALNDGQKKELKKSLAGKTRFAGGHDRETINEQVAHYVQRLVGKGVVGRGECTDLAEQALKFAGAKTVYAFGPITRDGDYVWGTPVELADVKAGDILQFRDSVVTTVTETEIIKVETSRGKIHTETSSQTKTSWNERPHHTAVVVSNEGGGTLIVVEQNVMDERTHKHSKVVQRNTLFVSSQPASTAIRRWSKGNSAFEEKTTISITVSGTIWAYRPVPEED